MSLSRVHTRCCTVTIITRYNFPNYNILLYFKSIMNGYSYVNSLTLTFVGNTTYTRELYVIEIEFIVPGGNKIAMTVKQLDRIIHCEIL